MPYPEREIVRPTWRGWARHLAITVPLSAAMFAPMYLIPATRWLDPPQTERALYWKIAGLVALYTAAGVVVAGLLIRRAWRIHRCGHWPAPGEFVPLPMAIRRDWRARLELHASLLAAALVISAIAAGWNALDMPTLLLGGYGEGMVHADPPCPAEARVMNDE